MASIEDACRLAVGLGADGHWDAAEDVYRQILAHCPGHPLTSYLYSHTLLSRGAYAEAWPLFMRRLDMDFYRAKGTTRLPQPYWDGSPAPDRRVLVHVDQGLGDLIMCARYIPAAAARVGRLIFAVTEGTRPLFSSINADIDIVEMGESAPEFDLHLHAFSLPAVFGTLPDTIPPARCLRAQPELAEQWRRRLGGGFKVGLCWQGNPSHPRDGVRSLAIEQLLPILRVPGCRFFSLQVGPGAEQISRLPAEIAITDLSAELSTADVMVPAAAAIANLDLVISIDSGLAHLAGALGAPVWIPLPYAPDWRWFRHGERTPWYPSARLFRQGTPGQWPDCIARMAAALDAQRAASSSPSDT